MTVRRCLHLSVFLLSLGIFAGCGQKNTFEAPPPPEVDVQKPIIEDTTVWMEFPGRTQAYRRVEIRARVQGFLESREFQPGQFVEKDQILFKIESKQFDAAVAAAEGNLAKANADFEIAKTNARRRRDAFEKNQAISEIEALSAEAEQLAAEAAVRIAQAALDDAKRDLSYTQIVSPVAGRVSRDLVDQGNLVGADGPTLLTTVIQDDPVYFNFEANERTILPYLKNRPTQERPGIKDNKVRGGDSEESSDGGGVKRAALQLTLSDGSVYPLPGTFDFIDNAVDPESGTIRVRAVFQNPDGALADGLFGRIGIPETIPNAVLVPRATVQRDLGGSFVLVVDPENKVVRRVVIPSSFAVEESRIIEGFSEETGTGLKPDDRIVVSNLQRARPGIVVAPTENNLKEEAAEPVPNPESEKKPDAEPAAKSAEQN